MSDEELVRLCAEKVMEWTEFGGDMAYPKVGLVVLVPSRGVGHLGDGIAMKIFNPLEDDADACAVLDKMNTQGYEYRIHADMYHTPLDLSLRNPWVCCEFRRWVSHEMRGTTIDAGRNNNRWARASSPDRRRAIVLAALKAVGVSIPTSA